MSVQFCCEIVNPVARNIKIVMKEVPSGPVEIPGNCHGNDLILLDVISMGGRGSLPWHGSYWPWVLSVGESQCACISKEVLRDTGKGGHFSFKAPSAREKQY